MDRAMDSYNFHEIPYVHGNEEGAYEQHGWQYGMPANRTIEVFGNHIPMSDPPLEMTTMERFMEGQGSFNGLLHAGFSRPIGSPPPHHPYYSTYNVGAQQPYPLLADYRAHSPSTTSSSGSQSSSPNEDIRPMHLLHNHGYGSPPDSESALGWGRETGYSQAIIPGGGSCIALQDIQGVPDPVADHHATEAHSQSSMQVEFKLFTPKMEVDDHYGDEDGACSHIPDADSAPWHNHDDDRSDSDYKPTTKSSKRLRKRAASQNSQDFNSRGGVKKHTHARMPSSVSSVGNGKKKPKRGEKASFSTSTKNGGEPSRPFPCPLAIYSCSSTFSSKNEWKRHVSTQHVRLGYWRCDLCAPSHDATLTSVYYNDFNRKDLFTQHLRRMHSTTADSKNNSVSSDSSEIPPVNENTIPAHQSRCFHPLRSPPPTSSCLFCQRTFSGQGSWEERMEHVGKHFEKDRKGSVEIANWRDDLALEKWFVKEGLIERTGEQGWKLGDGVPKNQDDDLDADGEEDDE